MCGCMRCAFVGPLVFGWNRRNNCLVMNVHRIFTMQLMLDRPLVSGNRCVEREGRKKKGGREGEGGMYVGREGEESKGKKEEEERKR